MRCEWHIAFDGGSGVLLHELPPAQKKSLNFAQENVSSADCHPLRRRQLLSKSVESPTRPGNRPQSRSLGDRLMIMDEIENIGDQRIFVTVVRMS